VEQVAHAVHEDHFGRTPAKWELKTVRMQHDIGESLLTEALGETFSVAVLAPRRHLGAASGSRSRRSTRSPTTRPFSHAPRPAYVRKMSLTMWFAVSFCDAKNR
jgi:hypothetical protein